MISLRKALTIQLYMIIRSKIVTDLDVHVRMNSYVLTSDAESISSTFCDTVLSNDQIYTYTNELCLVNCNLDVGETDLCDVSLNSYVFKSETGNLESNFCDNVSSNDHIHTIANEQCVVKSKLNVNNSTNSITNPQVSPTCNNSGSNVNPWYMNEGFNILHLNMHYLYPKLDEIKSTIADKHNDMMCFCESVLNDTFCDYISLYNFSLFRRDRGSNSGGLVVYLNNNYHCSRRYDLESSLLECIWLENILEFAYF